MTGQAVKIDYTNYRGERSIRTVRPISISWRSNQWHPEPQWLLDAFDLEKEAQRSFALKDIHSWQPAEAQS